MKKIKDTKIELLVKDHVVSGTASVSTQAPGGPIFPICPLFHVQSAIYFKVRDLNLKIAIFYVEIY